MFKERRKYKRKTLNYPARFAVEIGKIWECVVRDISEGGARLEVRDDTDLPERFSLLLSKQGSSLRKCRVVWRASHLIGVQFDERFPDEAIKTLV